MKCSPNSTEKLVQFLRYYECSVVIGYLQNESVMLFNKENCYEKWLPFHDVEKRDEMKWETVEQKKMR